MDIYYHVMYTTSTGIRHTLPSIKHAKVAEWTAQAFRNIGMTNVLVETW